MPINNLQKEILERLAIGLALTLTLPSEKEAEQISPFFRTMIKSIMYLDTILVIFAIHAYKQAGNQPHTRNATQAMFQEEAIKNLQGRDESPAATAK